MEFLYDSGLAVGKGSASGSGVSFQKEEQPLANAAEAGNSASEKPDPSAPGALFEDKTPSANDSWRKLHSDPLLLIRQREQEALARIKNNPVKMALIRKSVSFTLHAWFRNCIGYCLCFFFSLLPSIASDLLENLLCYRWKKKEKVKMEMQRSTRKSVSIVSPDTILTRRKILVKRLEENHVITEHQGIMTNTARGKVVISTMRDEGLT